MTNKMTDLEICKRIAEIEGKEIHSENNFSVNVIEFCFNLGCPAATQYSPLIDDALCFQLMVKYDMPPMKSGAPNLYECVFDLDRALSGAGIICDESPNKAICLAIIEANK